MSVLNLLLLATEIVFASITLPVLAALLARAFPRSAARRRLVWVVLFAVLLALPVAAAVTPSFAVIKLVSPAATPVSTMAAPETTEVPFSATSAALMLGLYAWAIGAAWIVARSLPSLVALHRLKRTAALVPPEHLPLPLPRGCTVWLSADCIGPMTWGAIRYIVLLPDDALDWPGANLEAALRHELAHVRRKDSLVQTLALLACALYWPNPLVWRAARALRREAETAADDAVLAAGMRPSDYATLLLDLANDWDAPKRPELGVAMAQPPILTERVQSILSPEASRTGATAMDTFKLALVGGAALAALALARPSIAEIAAPTAVPADLQTQQAASATPLADAPPVAATIRSRGHDKIVGSDEKQTPQLAQQAVPAPPARPVSQGWPPGLRAALAKGPVSVPYNQVTDDPASPGYIPAGQPGAGHPVPANLAKLLNARKGDPNAPWTLTLLPNPNGSAPAAAQPPVQPATPASPAPAAKSEPEAKLDPQTKIRVRLSDSGVGAIQGPGEKETSLTTEQRVELDRKLAQIGPELRKALAATHIEEQVTKALKDAHIEETVAKALKDAHAENIVAHSRIDLSVGQSQDTAKP